MKNKLISTGAQDKRIKLQKTVKDFFFTTKTANQQQGRKKLLQEGV